MINLKPYLQLQHKILCLLCLFLLSINPAMATNGINLIGFGTESLLMGVQILRLHVTPQHLTPTLLESRKFLEKC